MFEKYNYRVWLEEEVLDKLGLEDLIPTDSLFIFIERGKVEGVYDGGKIQDLRGVSVEEIAELVDQYDLVWERAEDTEKYLIDRDELIDAIRDTIHKSAGFQRHGGEIQLYGELDGLVVTGFQTVTFAGHNSWQEGENIIHLYTCKWFDPLEHEDLDEWFENEPEAREFESWDDFRTAHPGKWEGMLDEWRDLWLEVNTDDMIYEAIEDLEEDSEIEIK